MWDSVVNLSEWEGVPGQPAKKVATITYDYMATMDERHETCAKPLILRNRGGGGYPPTAALAHRLVMSPLSPERPDLLNYAEEKGGG
jgi:hypothetical protein